MQNTPSTSISEPAGGSGEVVSVPRSELRELIGRMAALSRRVEVLEKRLAGLPGAAAAEEAEASRQILTLANKAEISADNRRICPKCGRASRNVNALALHIRRVHFKTHEP